MKNSLKTPSWDKRCLPPLGSGRFIIGQILHEGKFYFLGERVYGTTSTCHLYQSFRSIVKDGGRGVGELPTFLPLGWVPTLTGG